MSDTCKASSASWTIHGLKKNFGLIDCLLPLENSRHTDSSAASIGMISCLLQPAVLIMLLDNCKLPELLVLIIHCEIFIPPPGSRSAKDDARSCKLTGVAFYEASHGR